MLVAKLTRDSDDQPEAFICEADVGGAVAAGEPTVSTCAEPDEVRSVLGVVDISDSEYVEVDGTTEGYVKSVAAEEADVGVVNGSWESVNEAPTAMQGTVIV